MIYLDPTAIVPIILFILIEVALIYSGICGLRGRDLWVPADRFGGRVGVVKGKMARVLGFIFLVLGCGMLYWVVAVLLSTYLML